MKSKYQKILTISHWMLVAGMSAAIAFALVSITGCDSSADHQVRPIVESHHVTGN